MRSQFLRVISCRTITSAFSFKSQSLTSSNLWFFKQTLKVTTVSNF